MVEGMKKKLGNLYKNFQKQRQLWLLCIPIIIWVIIFAYVPMYGLLIAFVDYIPGMSIFDCKFVGLKYFKDFVLSPVFLQLLRNTLAMSLMGLTFGFAAPILFALCVNELKDGKFKKAVQTTSYLPHFISWVVAGSMIFMLLSNEGVINDILLRLGLIGKAIPFLTEGKYYWVMYTIANIWKGMGWSSIIYLSAMSSMDNELIEAGAVDGMGRLGVVRYVILPTILPTIVVQWILGIGNILNAGFEQHLVLGNAATQNYWDVIDTYAYRYGIQLGYYSIGTAVGLMKSVIGLILVWATNWFCRKHLDTAIF